MVPHTPTRNLVKAVQVVRPTLVLSEAIAVERPVPDKLLKILKFVKLAKMEILTIAETASPPVLLAMEPPTSIPRPVKSVVVCLPVV